MQNPKSLIDSVKTAKKIRSLHLYFCRSNNTISPERHWSLSIDFSNYGFERNSFHWESEVDCESSGSDPPRRVPANRHFRTMTRPTIDSLIHSCREGCIIVPRVRLRSLRTIDPSESNPRHRNQSWYFSLHTVNNCVCITVST